jgi:amino acid transporter
MTSQDPPNTDTPGRHVHDSSTAGAVPADTSSTLREEVHAREREQFGGVKIGAAFFGWLTATGTAVLLTALASAIGAAVGLANNQTAQDAADAAADDPETVGLVGAIALVVILFIAYFAGGYVAGRMARFSGAKQGIAVWVWAVAIAIVVAIVAAIAGSQFNILANLNSFPRLPFNEGTLTATGLITAVAVAVVSLGGAILGGLAGMRYHRNVDRVGLAATD